MNERIVSASWGTAVAVDEIRSSMNFLLIEAFLWAREIRHLAALRIV